MDSVKDRLRKVVDALGIKPLTPASTCPGITKAMMYSMWNSDTGAVSSNILEPFCQVYVRVNCNYLLRGTGPMFLEGNENTTCDSKYYEMCKLILESKRRETELYNRIADIMGE